MAKNPHAVALGRKGGKAGKGKTSEAKAAAARENGKKGGRPASRLCPECDGKGWVVDAPSNVLAGRTYKETCDECNGLGRAKVAP